jgi:hypothetical protein
MTLYHQSHITHPHPSYTHLHLEYGNNEFHETSVTTYKIVWCHNPGYYSLNLHCFAILESPEEYYFLVCDTV